MLGTVLHKTATAAGSKLKSISAYGGFGIRRALKHAVGATEVDHNASNMKAMEIQKAIRGDDRLSPGLDLRTWSYPGPAERPNLSRKKKERSDASN